MVAHRIGGHGMPHSLEVVEAVMEVADFAWDAYEHRRKRPAPSAPSPPPENEELKGDEVDGEEAMAQILSENRRLRSVLEGNLKLLQSLSDSPAISKDCPPDLYARLMAAVDSANFSTQLQQLSLASANPADGGSPFKQAQEADLKAVDIMVYDDDIEPSRWEWVTEDMCHTKMEELSKIDNEHYVIICENDVVDGIAIFMASCILANPGSKKLAPEELKETVTKALEHMNNRTILKKVWHAGKVIYILSTWGIFLAGLYRHQAIVKAAAKGVYASGKFVLKAF